MTEVLVARRTVGTQTPPIFVEAPGAASMPSAITATTTTTGGVSAFPPLSVSAAAPTPPSEVPSPSPPPALAEPAASATAEATAATPASKKDKDSSTTTAAANSTTSNSSGAAIFSPKSAAVALSSLFTNSHTSANPRQCFPSSAAAPAAAAKPEASGMVPVTADDPSPAADHLKSSPTNALNAAANAGTPLATTPWNNAHESASAPPLMPPNNYCNMQQQHYPGQLPPPTPHHMQHANNGSPPGVFFNGYPPYHHESAGPHGHTPWAGRHPHAPPGPHHHHHHPQAPWGTPMHVGSKMNPNGTPHHHPSATRGPSPQAGFMWQGGHGPGVMEQPGTMVYHHHHSSYGHPPLPMKDGSDPNSAVRLASNNTSLVTPTPKKAKLADLAPRQPPHSVMQGPPGRHHRQALQRPPVGPPQMAGGGNIMHPPAPNGYAAAQVHPSAVLSQPSHQKPPTPPQDPAGYSRKKKSLGVLAENFLQRYQNCTPGTEVIVDEAAVELGVERRRIYDVVNILESIQLVVKKGKNTYSWLGKDYLPDVFGKLQSTAITDYPEDAKRYGLTTADEDPNATDGGGIQSRRNSMSSIASDDSKNTFRSLAKLSQQFLQVFLVGYDILSLPQASEMIQGTLSAEAYAAIGSAHAHLATRYDPHAPPPPCLENPLEFRRAAQRGLKTKIRRLYDIANVFLSVGLLRKVDASPTTSTIDALSSNRRPNFQWAFHMSPKQVQERFLTQKRNNLSHPQLLPPSVLALAQVSSKADERTPLRTIAAQGQWSSKQDAAEQTTPVASGSKAQPDSATTDGSCPPSAESNETTPAGDSMGTPSEENTAVFQDSEKNSSRVLLANIHQSGGAFHPSYRAKSATPGMLSRLVTLPTQQVVASASSTSNQD